MPDRACLVRAGTADSAPACRAHRHHQPRHLLLMPAGIALDAQDSVFEAPVVQVRLELFVDEVGGCCWLRPRVGQPM